MTLFEYLAIASSLVFSFAAMRLVSGLPHAIDADRRYWVHLCLVLTGLLATAVSFWGFWFYRDAHWTLPRFLLALTGPCVTYFNACALVPDAPGSVASWRRHYYSVRSKLFLGITLWSVAAATTITVLLETPINHPFRVAEAVLFGVGVVGASSDSPRVHAGLAMLLVALYSSQCSC